MEGERSAVDREQRKRSPTPKKYERDGSENQFSSGTTPTK